MATHEQLMLNPNYRKWWEDQQRQIREAGEQYEAAREQTARTLTEVGFTKDK